MSKTTLPAPPVPKNDAEGVERRNRYRDAPRNADYTIDQNWASYSDKEHDRWDRLFQRQHKILATRACEEFTNALTLLRLSEAGIPDMGQLSDRLEAITGWRVVPVADLVPDDIFFNHLAQRRFPAGAFIRPESELDYLQEPDVFHDIFGHVPLLANPVFADFMQAYGKGGQRAIERDMLKNLARLYWYTVEFGLIRSSTGLKLFGAGILSSAAESVFALEDPSPHRINFDLKRVMRTNYIIDNFQQSYFVIDSFQQLLDDCYQDFEAVYDYLETTAAIEPDQTAPGDAIVNLGSLAHFK
ncbi:MAG: phenylalanine 4-monooxygenase [Burkholderiaceae bacterium]